jgi:hypothetical protein
MSYALAQKSTITLSCWNRPKPIFAGDVAMAEPANIGGKTGKARKHPVLGSRRSPLGRVCRVNSNQQDFRRY